MFWTLYARASREETSITGIFKDSAIAFIEEIPIRIPVKEPRTYIAADCVYIR